MGILKDIKTVITKNKGNVSRLIISYGITFTSTAIEIANPFLLIYSINHALNKDEPEHKRVFALSLYALSWAGVRILTSSRKMLLSPLKSDLADYLTKKIIRKYYAQPLSSRLGSSNYQETQFFITNYVRVGENFMLETNDKLIPAAIEGLAIASALTVMYPFIGGSLCGVFIIQTFFAKIGSRFVATAEQNISRARFATMERIDTRLERYIEANSFNRVDYEMQQLSEDLAPLNEQDSKRDISSEVVAILQGIFIALGAMMGIALLGYYVTKEIQDEEDLIKVLLYLISYSNQLDIFSRALGNVQGTRVIYKRIADYLDQKHDFSNEHMLADLPEDPSKPELKIEFQDISHSYDAKNYALWKINFQIHPNELVYIIGGSGAGKSTILQLMTKSYIPTEGKILFNDLDIHKFNRRSIVKNISFISQNSTLSNETIYENVRYAAPSATKQQIDDAIHKAQLSEFTKTFGEQKIGQNGGHLSGGQRQRLAIARAILKLIVCHSKIIVADEPTSALNTATAREILAILYGLTARASVIIVTHDLSIIDNERNDKIIVMEKGQIAEAGTFKELIGKNGYFAAQYNLSQKSMKYSSHIVSNNNNDTRKDKEEIETEEPDLRQPLLGGSSSFRKIN